jgi:hypothetical protein
LTVPASFDEVARSLTAEAAKAAGLGDVTLLEEPQAAFYAWTAKASRTWRDLVAPGDIVLVCDVGGGTADFSLIAVTDVEGALELERVSVGEHILLGGDNMDLALAHALQAQLEAAGKPLDSWQFLALVHAASKAKITLFEDGALRQAPIAVPSRGTKLLARTVSTTLDREMLEQIVLDGFSARTGISDMPSESRTGGLREFGLPYASDPVVSKHIARFLDRSLQNMKASEKLAALVGARAERTCWFQPRCCSTAASLRPRRSAPACLTCWRAGTGNNRSANCRVSSRISPSHEAPRSTGVTAPLIIALVQHGGCCLLVFRR